MGAILGCLWEGEGVNIGHLALQKWGGFPFNHHCREESVLGHP